MSNPTNPAKTPAQANVASMSEAAQAKFAKSYKQQSYALLKHTFPLVSAACIKRAFGHHDSSFTETYGTISRVDSVRIHATRLKANARERILEHVPFLSDDKDPIVIKNLRQSRPPRPTNRILVDELDNIPEFSEKENRLPQFKTTGAEDETEEPDGDIECRCCFGDYLFHEMVQCENGHLFCQECVRNHVTEQVHGKRTSEIPCMASVGNNPCSFGFSHSELERGLPPGVMENWNKLDYEENVKQAEMADGWTCPTCAIVFFIGQSDTTAVVQCPACDKQFCRLCKEAPHDRKTCQEAAAENERANVVAGAAEAMTDAVIRKCPKCRVPFMKEEGCNKMTCPNRRCGALSCYVCRKKITGYEHFCQTPHCDHKKCGKCILFTDSKQDDERARREAGLKEQKKAGKTAADVGLLLSTSIKQPPTDVTGNRPLPRPALVHPQAAVLANPQQNRQAGPLGEPRQQRPGQVYQQPPQPADAQQQAPVQVNRQPPQQAELHQQAPVQVDRQPPQPAEARQQAPVQTNRQLPQAELRQHAPIQVDQQPPQPAEARQQAPDQANLQPPQPAEARQLAPIQANRQHPQPAELRQQAPVHINRQPPQPAEARQQAPVQANRQPPQPAEARQLAPVQATRQHPQPAELRQQAPVHIDRQPPQLAEARQQAPVQTNRQPPQQAVVQANRQSPQHAEPHQQAPNPDSQIRQQAPVPDNRQPQRLPEARQHARVPDSHQPPPRPAEVGLKHADASPPQHAAVIQNVVASPPPQADAVGGKYSCCIIV